MKPTLAPIDDVVHFEVGHMISFPLANPKGEYVRCDGRKSVVTVTSVDRERGVVTAHVDWLFSGSEQ